MFNQISLGFNSQHVSNSLFTGEKIIFFRNTGTYDQIHIASTNYSGLTNISSNSVNNRHPHFILGDTKIVYVQFNGAGTIGDVCTMNADGSDKTNLTNFGIARIAYFPDMNRQGTEIWWIQSDNKIYKMNLNTLVITSFATTAGYNGTYNFVRCCPIHDVILWADNSYALGIIDYSGNSPTEYTGGLGYGMIVAGLTVAHASWNKAGTAVAYTKFLAGRWNITYKGSAYSNGGVENNSTNNADIRTPQTTDSYFPSFSPDGLSILSETYLSTGITPLLYTAPFDGATANINNTGNTAIADFFPDWGLIT